jgi:hypothetical protein
VSESDDAQPAAIERVKEALAARTLQQVAEVLAEPLSTVKGWSARGSVPLDQLRRVKELSGRSLDWLADGDVGTGKPTKVEKSVRQHEAQAPSPPAYVSRVDSGKDEHFGPRLAAAMEIIEAGLAAKGVDAARVPRYEMSAEVYRLLPWPIPKLPATRKP